LQARPQKPGFLLYSREDFDFSRNLMGPSSVILQKELLLLGKNLSYEALFTPYLACSGGYTFDSLNV
jgi:hypothetical protein